MIVVQSLFGKVQVSYNGFDRCVGKEVSGHMTLECPSLHDALDIARIEICKQHGSHFELWELTIRRTALNQVLPCGNATGASE